MTEELAPEPGSDALSGLRRELAAVVATGSGFTAEAFLPDKLTPPVSVVTPGTPYLLPGSTYGSFLCQLKVTIVLRSKSNKVITNELDTATTGVVVAVVNAGFAVLSVGQPGAFESGGATYFAVDLTVSKTIHL